MSPSNAVSRSPAQHVFLKIRKCCWCARALGITVSAAALVSLCNPVCGFAGCSALLNDLAEVPTSFQGGTGRWERVVAPAVQELAWAQNPVLRRRLDEAVTSEKGGLVAFLPWDDPAQVHCFKRALKFPPDTCE